ncbi:unnamed protein product [Prunus brigantina]
MLNWGMKSTGLQLDSEVKVWEPCKCRQYWQCSVLGQLPHKLPFAHSMVFSFDSSCLMITNIRLRFLRLLLFSFSLQNISE